MPVCDLVRVLRASSTALLRSLLQAGRATALSAEAPQAGGDHALAVKGELRVLDVLDEGGPLLEVLRALTAHRDGAVLERAHRVLVSRNVLRLDAQHSVVVLAPALIFVGHAVRLPRGVAPPRAAIVLRVPESELVLDVLAHGGDDVALVLDEHPPSS